MARFASLFAWSAAAFLTLPGLCVPTERAASGESRVPGALVSKDILRECFEHPDDQARPWVLWYWIQGNVSKEGITADLASLRQAGFSGAYLVGIKPPAENSPIGKPIVQLTPEWWDHVRFAFSEADRLGLKLGLFNGDGFATSGGPWITPELSMQKLTWSELLVDSQDTRERELRLAKPPTKEGYYKDIAVLAFPVPGDVTTLESLEPDSTACSVEDFNAGLLCKPGKHEPLRSEKTAWVQYSYKKPVTVRSLRITPSGNNFRALHGHVEVSEDGRVFRRVADFSAARHGWLDWDFPHSYSIPPAKARHFRIYFDLEGSEPGAEDLDSAKWTAVLKLTTLELLNRPVVDAFEGKTGLVWRKGAITGANRLPVAEYVQPDQVLNVTNECGADGVLRTKLPPGRWIILRLGHTSTGHRNETAGGGKGLECDKLSSSAVLFQYSNYFDRFHTEVGADLARRVLSTFHVDSWECGSQNWTPGLEGLLLADNRYPFTGYLPALAGWPVCDAAQTEGFLQAHRERIASLLNSHFFDTLRDLCAQNGHIFSSETTAPVMGADGLSHFRHVTVPMGEFWLRSPTHDKPNDMLDAISGAHVYGKPVVQAEAFTELRIAWDESPAMLKPLGDLAFARGANRFVYHVLPLNPWPGRSPSITLGGVGLQLGANQPWWSQSRAYFDYISRSQSLLQMGAPVVDIAVFTGDELPSRALTPAKLVALLPGLCDPDFVVAEQLRLANVGQPVREQPVGVRHSANIEASHQPVQPLRGHAYDSVNADALLGASAEGSGLRLSSGMRYQILVVPPSAYRQQGLLDFNPKTAETLRSLAQAGVHVLFCDPLDAEKLLPADSVQALRRRGLLGAWTGNDLSSLSISPDLQAHTSDGAAIRDIAWNHRKGAGYELYFLSNQSAADIDCRLSVRGSHASAEFWDPLTGDCSLLETPSLVEGRSQCRLRLTGFQSCFVLFSARDSTQLSQRLALTAPAQALEIGEWTLRFEAQRGGPAEVIKTKVLFDWSTHPEPSVRNYSGPVEYCAYFEYHGPDAGPASLLSLGEVRDLASVTLNGVALGTSWCAPHEVALRGALRRGRNEIRIKLSNTWLNRIRFDLSLPAANRLTWAFPEAKCHAKAPLSSGLLGPLSVKLTPISSK